MAAFSYFHKISDNPYPIFLFIAFLCTQYCPVHMSLFHHSFRPMNNNLSFRIFSAVFQPAQLSWSLAYFALPLAICYHSNPFSAFSVLSPISLSIFLIRSFISSSLHIFHILRSPYSDTHFSHFINPSK